MSSTENAPSTSNDFDFLAGTWHGTNRRLTKILAGCDEWDEFPSVTECVRLFDGAANVDWITFPTKGYSGLTMRFFDPVRELWSIYWASSRTPTLLLDPPVIGRFEDGRGEFFCDDTYEGQDIRVRYVWLPRGDTSARWEQAFSVDGGLTWETNWTMEFTRP